MDERIEVQGELRRDQSAAMQSVEPQPGGYTEIPGGSYGYMQDDDRANLQQIWRVLKKRFRLVAIIVTVATTVVTVQVFREKSIYQASATIQLEKENRTLVRSGDLVVQSDDSDNPYSITMGMKTRIRFLQSRPVFEEVVSRMKLDQNPKFLDITGRKSILGALKSIGGEFRRSEIAQPVIADTTGQKSSGSGENSFEESARLAPFVQVLSENLTAEPLPETSMLVVSFTHTDPGLAAAIANTAAAVFIERSFQTKTEKFTDTANWLDRTTREFKAKVEQAEQNLANYTKENNLFSADGKETLTTDKLSRMFDQATRAETERILKQSLFEEVKNGRAAQLPDAFSDPKLGSLQAKLGELSVTAAQLDVKYGPDNPKILEIKQQMEEVQQQIDASRNQLEGKLKADYERSVRDEQSLKSALERAKSEAALQNQANIQFSLLKQDVDTAIQVYTEFLQKTNQAKVQEAEQHNNIQLIESALPPLGPVGPQRLRTIFIGFFVSLLGALGLAFALEYLDNTVKTADDASRYAQVPVLGVIPAFEPRGLLGLSKAKALAIKGRAEASPAEPPPDDGLMALDGNSAVAEAYRALRTSMLLSTAGNPPKTILVTSGQPGDGKTTTAMNAAVSLAQLEASVLVIACDMRRPAEHKIAGINYNVGLSNYLSGDVELDELIQAMPTPNLSFLPSGPIPPNPAELLSSRKMRALLGLMAQRFDHIILDSPPLLLVTDPIVLSTMVDGVILVVHAGKNTRDMLRRARQELSAAGAKIFGVVLNNLDARHEGYGDYYYHGYYSDQNARTAESTGQ